MVVGGVPVPQNNNAERVAKAALEMCANPRQGWHSLDLPLSVRIGMATGDVVAGVIGRKKFETGDDCNTCSGWKEKDISGQLAGSCVCRRSESSGVQSRWLHALASSSALARFP